GQEPDVLRAGNAFSTFQVIQGDNMRNYGLIDLNGQLTRELGFQAGYGNTWYNYADNTPTAGGPSNAGLLNRIDNIIHLDSRWTLRPQTIGVVGYQFKQVNYTGDELLGFTGGGQPIFSDNRNDRENYLYLGADNTFSPTLVGSARLGGR